MGLTKKQGDAVVEITGKKGAGEVVEGAMTAEVVAEPEVDHFEVSHSGEVPEVGRGVFAEMSGVGRLFADYLEGAVAGKQQEAFAEADGVGGLEEEQAAGAKPGGDAGEDQGGGGVEVFEDFRHYDDVVGRKLGPLCGVNRAVEVEFGVLAVELSVEARVFEAQRIDRQVGEGILKEDSLEGEANVQETCGSWWSGGDPPEGIHQKLIAALMEPSVFGVCTIHLSTPFMIAARGKKADVPGCPLRSSNSTIQPISPEMLVVRFKQSVVYAACSSMNADPYPRSCG